jgi:adenylate cyclase
VALLNFVLIDNSISDYYGGLRSFLIIVSWILGFLIYQIGTVTYLRKKLLSGKRTSTTFKIIHTMIEVSFPTLVTLYMIAQLNMLSFIDSPVTLMYFLLIILCVLHLDPRVSLFTGVLAATQYAALTYYGFNFVTVADAYLPSAPENAHYVRALIIILCGWAAAFVSGELRKRIKAAFDTQQAKNELELLFGQHVSKEVSRALIEEKGATKRLEATVMFLDIRNFTLFADSHTADEVVDYQNKFFGPVINIVNQHQGVVLQILGDGLMACFGTPARNPLHADMAFQAGLQILKHTQSASRNGEIQPTSIGIGLHSGEMIAGNIGNEQRKQFSISGTPVIVASRIEQLNKKYQTEFLISEDVLNRITPGKTELICRGEESLKGIEKPVKIYEVTY